MAARRRRGRVSSLSLVRYRGTDYSVPTAYGHLDVLVRGYVHTVVISGGADVIARNSKSYEREDFVFDPLHYLALLDRTRSSAIDIIGFRRVHKLEEIYGVTCGQLPRASETTPLSLPETTSDSIGGRPPRTGTEMIRPNRWIGRWIGASLFSDR
jgi:hypothetical protein